MRLNPDGTIRWNYAVGTGRDDELRDIAQTADGGFIATGYSRFKGAEEDVALIKITANGSVEWVKRYQGPGHDEGKIVFPLVDGYAVAGYTASFNGNKVFDWPDDGTENPYQQYDGFLMRTDLDGNLQWFKVYGNQATQWAFGAARAKDGGFAIVGQANGYGAGKSDFWLVKTDALGDAGCAMIDVPKGDLLVEKMSTSKESFKPPHYTGAFKLPAEVKVKEVALTEGFATGVCKCE